MKDYFIFPNGEGVKVPKWALYLTIDGDGDVTAWGKKPHHNEIYNQWYVRFAKRESIFHFDEEIKNSSEQIFQLKPAEHEKKVSDE